MHVDFLIIGQGLAGTFLAMELQRQNASIIVIDDARPSAASAIASGIINPLTGRRIVKTWMIDELMPFAWNAYHKISEAVGISCIQETGIIDCFPTPQMRLAFLERLGEDAQYLSLHPASINWSDYLQYDFGYGIISPCYLVDVLTLLQAARKKFVSDNVLLKEKFEYGLLTDMPNRILYKDITAGKTIFCDGISGAENSYFRLLPFAPNKGEALIVAIKDLPATNIVKKGITIVPWKDGLFWVGSSHEWQFDNDQPTDAFREKTTAQLKAFLKMPFTIVDHVAAVRPATLERRPFIGFHPHHPQVGIFNGMGTKGCSLAPYFARQLAMHCVDGTPLSAEVDVKRFTRVLGRGG